jgi:hypothetical protein
MANWIHEDCGGEIIFFEDHDGEFYECNACGELWDDLSFFNLVKVNG